MIAIMEKPYVAVYFSDETIHYRSFDFNEDALNFADDCKYDGFEFKSAGDVKVLYPSSSIVKIEVWKSNEYE